MNGTRVHNPGRAALGEENAKVFAQTLGAMIEEAKNAATKDDIRPNVDRLDEAPRGVGAADRRERLARPRALPSARTQP